MCDSASKITSTTILLSLLSLLILYAVPAKRQGACADKLQVKAARILPLVGLARSKQDPINRGHGAEYYTGHVIQGT